MANARRQRVLALGAAGAVGAAVAALTACAAKPAAMSASHRSTAQARPTAPVRPTQADRKPAAASGQWAAAAYYYLGTAAAPATQIMAATGVRRFTLAFIQSDGRCNPAWQGQDPLTGGAEQATIGAIRAAGGDVAVAFGGMGGTKFGITCGTPKALAAAYQKVIDALGLRAVDVDVEDTEISDAAVRQRVISALGIVRRHDPSLIISVTIGTDPTGPDDAGRDLITRAGAGRLRVDAWTIMPFDFGADVPGTSAGAGASGMGRVSVQAAEGLKHDLMSAYHEPAAAAYRTMGISSMNGRTDTGEVVRLADFQVMLNYAREHHLARFAFWSVNRDRPCGHGGSADSCSGIRQAPYAFTSIVARYRG